MMTHFGKRLRKAALISMAAAAAIGVVTVSDFGPSVTPAAAVDTAKPAADQPKTDKKPEKGAIFGHTKILLVNYRVDHDCEVFANYPINPAGKHWTAPKGSTIVWRYNVTKKVALVSDLQRIDDDKSTHWGFVHDSSCIGKSEGQNGHYWVGDGKKWIRREIPPYPAGVPIPSRIRSGRSQNQDSWLTVDWEPDGGAIPSRSIKTTSTHTLRDAPANFVIGNVYEGWEVRPTGEQRKGFTKVYVPSLRRWGWLQI